MWMGYSNKLFQSTLYKTTNMNFYFENLSIQRYNWAKARLCSFKLTFLSVKTWSKIIIWSIINNVCNINTFFQCAKGKKTTTKNLKKIKIQKEKIKIIILSIVLWFQWIVFLPLVSITWHLSFPAWLYLWTILLYNIASVHESFRHLPVHSCIKILNSTSRAF